MSNLPETSTAESFLAAWKSAIALVGFRYFGDGTPAGCALATDKNALRPRWDAIEPAFPDMSPGEQVFLAHVLTFFNSGRGGWPVAKYLAAIPNVSVGAAASTLDSGRRAALAALLVSYEGW